MSVFVDDGSQAQSGYERGRTAGMQYASRDAAICIAEEPDVDRILRHGATGADAAFLAGFREGLSLMSRAR